MSSGSGSSSSSSAGKSVDSAEPSRWTAQRLRSVLSRPDDHQLGSGVWFALDPPAVFDERLAAHSLPARLGISPELLMRLMKEAFGDRLMAETIRKALNLELSGADLSGDVRVSRDTMYFEGQKVTTKPHTIDLCPRTHLYALCLSLSRTYDHADITLTSASPSRLLSRGYRAPQVKMIAFAPDVSTSPADQIQDGSTLPQPSPVEATRRVLASEERKRSLRSAGEAVEPTETPRAPPEEPIPKQQPNAPARPSLASLLEWPVRVLAVSSGALCLSECS